MYRYILSSLFGVFSIAVITFVPDHVNASCGSANCFLVTGTQEGIATPGQIILDLSYRFIPMDRIKKGGESSSEALVPGVNFSTGEIEPDHHREKRTNNELVQADVSYGITPRFAITLAIPFLNNRLHEHDVEVGTSNEHFSNQDGTSGFGDVRFTGKYAIRMSAKHLLVGGIGVKTPTGEYRLLNHDGEINEPTIQPGSGSWDGLASAYYAYQVMPQRLRAFIYGSYQIATENDLGYRFGNTLILNAGMNYLVSTVERPLTMSLQVNMREAPHDEFEGEEVPGTGGTWVYLTPGVMVNATHQTTFYLHVQLPVYQYVNEANLAPRYGVIFGISHAINFLTQ